MPYAMTPSLPLRKRLDTRVLFRFQARRRSRHELQEVSIKFVGQGRARRAYLGCERRALTEWHALLAMLS